VEVEDQTTSRRTSFAEIFEAQCPIYMAYGMTYEQFWDGDPHAVKAFRQAYELKRDMENEHMWLQGMYIYDAIQRLIPAMRVMSSDNPEPYPDKPYEIRPKTKAEKKSAERKAMDDMQAYLEGIMAKQNAEEKRKGEKHG